MRIKTKLIRLLVASILAAVPGAAAPASFEDARAAYERADYAAAAQTFRLLAAQGYAGAQHNLGLMYHNGQGVPQDYTQAVKWYRLAAEQGHPLAQYGLGLMYANGQGVPQDYTQAIKWFRLAAEQGYASAQYHLGLMYATGEGVPQDYVEAHKWLNLAAARFSASEKEDRQKAVNNRDVVAGIMTPAQVAEAQRLAREWKPTPEGLGR